MKRKFFAGFTLLEVLVVVAIIGILISIGTASFTSAQKKARDGRRQGDLKSIQTAFEQYNADNNGNYPATCSVDVTYLPAGLPKDPKTGANYTSSCSATSYCFCGLLEGTATGGNSTNASCTFGSGAYFCVKNLQ